MDLDIPFFSRTTLTNDASRKPGLQVEPFIQDSFCSNENAIPLPRLQFTSITVISLAPLSLSRLVLLVLGRCRECCHLTWDH